MFNWVVELAVFTIQMNYNSNSNCWATEVVMFSLKFFEMEKRKPMNKVEFSGENWTLNPWFTTGFIRSWKVMKSHGIWKCIFQAWKSHGFWVKWPRSWKSHGISFFWPKDFVLFENWKNSPSHRAKICPQKAGFSAFLSHGVFKLVMKTSWKSHWILLENFCN